MASDQPKPSPNFLHHCRKCGYEVVLPQDDSRHSVCPKCPTDQRFKVTRTDRPAIDESYGGK